MRPVRNYSPAVSVAVCVAAALAASPALAAAQDGYRQPPAPIAQILDAEPTPSVSVSPDHSWLLLMERQDLPPISEVAGPELRLAGERISPRTNDRTRERGFDGLRLRSVDGDAERAIQTPSGGRLGDVSWSSDGSRIAFTVTSDSGVSLWVAEVASGKSRAVTGPVLNGTTGAPCQWRSASSFACRLVVADRGAPPPEPTVPAGPIIQESKGRAAPNRTYEDLLESPHDEALFDYYFSSQVALVSLDGRITPVGEPGVHSSADPSPDGRYLYVETVHKPYSYLVPMGRFPVRMEIWDSAGAVVRKIADRPSQEAIALGFDAVTTGPRRVSWRNDAASTLVWAEALDGGDPRREAAKRDRLVALGAPFSGSPVTLLEVESRIRNVTWGNDQLSLVDEYWWKNRHTRTWIVNPTAPGKARKLFDRSTEDRYGDPGRFVTARGKLGTEVLLTTKGGKSAYLTGTGASQEGDRPFLDRIDMATGKTTRLWRSQAPYYEQVVELLDADGRRIVTRRESVKDVPNYFLRDLSRKGRLTQLTAFEDPAPQFAGVTSRLIRYKRADGVDLSATLYLPAGYDTSQGPLPFLFWAYPREFRSATAASQTVGSPYRFTRPSGMSHLFLLTQGYGVLDGPTMPIIGEGSAHPNDHYVEQLVSSAAAAVDEVVRLGVADRDRIAIGGHSYGAFMTANLLAHSRLFAAGIARSGAYNRSLTPFGFQQEERTYWKALDVYTRMSPFTYADSVKAPILLIHGMADDNSGTFPVQSERFYAALKGNGATVRYVQLPAEAHGYRARESVGHTLWEMVNWLDTWVKNAHKPTTE
ncbi:MAG TPA: prolyl oligopeptidase family serine peptidase [Gemmatimonadaceae bacterium]|nr:prolyl oligopeptidase family serine peptidase [Gemmatimonadaceae bacterium]